jgi:hypothetical protein
MTNTGFQTERIPFKVVAILSAVVGLVFLGYLVGARAYLDTLTIFLGDAGLAAVIFLSAGGWGDLFISRLLPKDTPRGLRIATGCALGLYFLSMVMLLLGSGGLLMSWLFWAIIGGGVIATLIRATSALDALKLPNLVTSRALVWVVLALAGAIWLGGMSRPAAHTRIDAVTRFDAQASVQHTLQLPREYYDNGAITPLDHNVASYLPQNMEMLSLLTMSLRANAWSGMYAAKAIHGFMGILAVVAIFTSLPANRFRSAAGAVLLATTPLVLYTSWVASYELGQILYLSLAVLWMGRWLKQAEWRNAIPIGLALGAVMGCAYGSLTAVVIPVLLVMVLASLRKPARILHVAGIILIAILLVSPWLIRTGIATGNPVFPIATETFGGPDHWTDQSQARWAAAHSVSERGPVPAFDALTDAPTNVWPMRLQSLYDGFLLQEGFGPMTLLLAGIALCVLVADQKKRPWQWALMGVAGTQLGLWFAFSPNMTSASLLPIIVPIALLVGALIERLEGVTVNPFRKDRDKAPTPWGRTASQIILSLAVIVNILVAAQGTLYTRRDARAAPPLPPANVSRDLFTYWYDLGTDPTLMLIGEKQVFYFPGDVVYAGPFDTHPLTAMIREGLDAEQILERLEGMGVTHIWINWNDLRSAMIHFGVSPELSSEALAMIDPDTLRYTAKPVMGLLNVLTPLGVTELTAQPQEGDPPEFAEMADNANATYTVYALPQVGIDADVPPESIDNPVPESHDSTQQD